MNQTNANGPALQGTSSVNSQQLNQQRLECDQQVNKWCGFGDE